MTPQEELFKEYYNNERMQIKDMDVLELRAHRETLAKIAFEARARLTAVDDLDRENKAKADKSRPKGFATSLQVDELTTGAINKIKERQTKLTKQEKILAGLEKLGIDSAEAQRIMSAGTLLAKVRENEKKAGITKPEPALNFTNPFGKKEEPVPQAVDVTIQEETNTIVIVKEDKPVENKGFTNPFAK